MARLSLPPATAMTAAPSAGLPRRLQRGAPDSPALPVRLDAARRILIGIEAIASARHRVGIDVGREDLQLDLAFRGVDLLAKEHGEGISFLAGTATGRRPYQALPELTAELAKIGR